ncbi:hypothetical protein [Shewanella sp. YLB-07]|nr:hypothetical protein [Shewanella sp. YLB-07]
MDPFIAESEGKQLGFADLQSDGYIDHFSVMWITKGRGEVKL